VSAPDTLDVVGGTPGEDTKKQYFAKNSGGGPFVVGCEVDMLRPRPTGGGEAERAGGDFFFGGDPPPSLLASFLNVGRTGMSSFIAPARAPSLVGGGDVGSEVGNAIEDGPPSEAVTYAVFVVVVVVEDESSDRLPASASGFNLLPTNRTTSSSPPITSRTASCSGLLSKSGVLKVESPESSCGCCGGGPPPSGVAGG
jgi:hypothetical protein